jgi:hypothetical protein
VPRGTKALSPGHQTVVSLADAKEELSFTDEEPLVLCVMHVVRRPTLPYRRALEHRGLPPVSTDESLQ